MNPHIEKINSYLIGVKFSYIELGWIKDLPPLYGNVVFDTPHMALSEDGVLILNKDDNDLYRLMKDMIGNKIMPLSDKGLKLHIQDVQSYQNTPKFDKWDEVYLWMLETEQSRRDVIKNGKVVSKKWQLWERLYN